MAQIYAFRPLWAVAFLVTTTFSQPAFSQTQSLRNSGSQVANRLLNRTADVSQAEAQAKGHLSDSASTQPDRILPSTNVLPGGSDSSQHSVQLSTHSQFLQSTTSCSCNYCRAVGEGSWLWIRNHDEERKRAIRIYNTQCVRCHGVQGKGVWDIPDIPNFTNRRWQQSRTDADIVRLTLGGRGACMPAFKGTITTDEAWAIARYIRDLGLPAIERETTDDQSEKKESSKIKPKESKAKESSKEEDTSGTEGVEARSPVFYRSR